MKNLIVIISACLFVLFACSNENEKNNSGSHRSDQKSEHYLNYDFELDIKSTTTIDTVVFRNEMNKILSPKRIVELFGSGYQVFYLLLEINADGTNIFKISPEAGSWLTGWSRFERGLFKENLELSKDYAIIPSITGDSKAVNVKDIFRTNYSVRDKNFFKASPGSLNGKKVRSGKVFQIDISLLDNGEISTPWNIKEVDLAKFKPRFNRNQNKDNYLGYFPAVLKSDYKLLKNRIVFPKEAIKRDVSGKVFVKIFFEETGDYAGCQLIKGLGYGIDEEVIKAITESSVSGYPTGEKTSIILPINFGISKDTPVDLTIKSLVYNALSKHNKLELTLLNKLPIHSSSNIKYAIYVFLNNELIFSDYTASLGRDSKAGPQYWFGGNKIKPGEHEYKISIDPENVLNDVDRSNNIVRGKLVIK